MGILRNGMFGGFEKRTGLLVGRIIRKQNVVSMVPHRSLKSFTVAQMDQQIKFAMVATFLGCFKQLIAIGFYGAGNFTTAYNSAIKHNFSNLIVGVYPDYSIDYAKLLYSKGKLEGPNLPAVVGNGNSGLVFSWLADRQNRFNLHSDMACFMVYNPAKGIALTFAAVVSRAALAYGVQLPHSFNGDVLHCYMSFVSARSHEVSDSVYLGSVIV